MKAFLCALLVGAVAAIELESEQLIFAIFAATWLALKGIELANRNSQREEQPQINITIQMQENELTSDTQENGVESEERNDPFTVIKGGKSDD